MDSQSSLLNKSFISFNMHGLKQGICYLDQVCAAKNDVILLQETWLNFDSAIVTFNCYNSDYRSFCSSAMDNSLTSGLLKGRPYGGMCSLLSNNFCNLFTKVECICASPNFIIISADELLIVNVYLPSAQSVCALDNLTLILDQLIDNCASIHYNNIIIGGDCNCNVTQAGNISNLINAKFNSLNASHCYNFVNIPLTDNFTFSVPNRAAFSLIDFFFISNHLGNHVSSCAIVDSPCNFSDHRPVLVNISSSAGFDLDRLPHRTNHFESPCTASISNKLAFIWDVNNFSKYYDCTRSQFAELSRLFAAYDFNQLALLRPDFFSSRGANTLYKNVIHSLLNCSLECFKVKSNGARGKQNWWWDNSLKVAKAASCSSFNAWQLSGSIADSPEHQVYLAARRKLKKLIHSKKRDANQSLNENLFCSLNSCNTQKFWRLWNANFKTNNGRSIYSFEDAHSDPDIANLLANSHKKNCSPSNEFLNNKRKLEFSDKKSNYVSSGFFQPIVLTATQIEKAISDISNNTAPGHDSICIEHLKLAHPSVFLILAVIFNIFLYLGEVPCDFGLGIVSPIPKFKGHKRKVSPDDFRGITLNVIPSKIFEHAIAYFLRPLATSDRQFGFKVGSGCNYAINTVKNTINFFNKRGSTVNVCCLDIKKAFDRANWWGILLMLQRKNINPQIINVIEHWFMISSAQVRWNGCLSDPISLAAGVRQGGVLSPLIFFCLY